MGRGRAEVGALFKPRLPSRALQTGRRLTTAWTRDNADFVSGLRGATEIAGHTAAAGGGVSENWAETHQSCRSAPARQGAPPTFHGY
jgi:hypothetical protein